MTRDILEKKLAAIEVRRTAALAPQPVPVDGSVLTIKGAFTRIREGKQIEDSIALLQSVIKQLIMEREARDAAIADIPDLCSYLVEAHDEIDRLKVGK